MGVLSTVLIVVLVVILLGLLYIRRRLATAKPVGPQPPIVSGTKPFVRAGIDWLSNPREFLNQKRKEVGDTFILEAFGLKLFFVFSNKGLTDFYHIPESSASFLEATRAFLGFKVPAEVMVGEMPIIQKVLKRDFQKLWIASLNQSVQQELDDLGREGVLDVFKWTKQVMHRAGFSVWVGPEANDAKTLQKLIKHFDQIDPDQDMRSLFSTVITRQSAEKSALQELIDTFVSIRKSRKEPHGDFFEAMFDEFSNLSEKDQATRATCAIIAIHMASQTNLFAAVSWTFVNVLQYPEHLALVKNEIEELKDKYGSVDYMTNPQAMMGDGLTHLEKCFHESIRLAQQSLTLRLVLKPVKLEQYTVVEGYYIATLLSCLNTDDTLLHKASEFLPEEHYEKGGKAKSLIPGAEHSISTFGHLVHQCPGKKFAITAAKMAIVSLLDNFILEHQFPEGGVKILSTQIGAVGRPTQPALVSYKRRS